MFGLRKKKEIKEICSLNKETIKTISSELGIPEEKVPMIAEKLTNDEQFIDAIARKINFGVVRRALVGAMAAGAFVATASPALARMTITDQYIQLDDKKYYLPIAPYSAIVYIDGGKVKAEDWKGKIISEGEAGVDDAKVIQSALDIGGRIVLGKGEFIVNKTLLVKSYTIIEGLGWDETKLKAADGLNDKMIKNYNHGSDYVYRVVIKDLLIDGNKENQSLEIGNNVIDLRIPVDCKIENVKVINAPDSSIVIDSYYAGGLIAKSNMLINCYSYDSADYGFYILGENTTLLHCHIKGGYGFAIKGATGYNKLFGCLAKDCGHHGLYAEATESVDIIGCSFISNSRWGIALNGCSQFRIIGGEILNNNQDTSASYGGIYLYNSVRNKIIGVRVEDTQDTPTQDVGIKEGGSSDNNIIAYCTVRNNKTEQIVIVGANTIIRRNIGYLTENSGVATFSGDGSTTDFLIGDHGLAVTDPSKIVVKVTPISSDAIDASPCIGYVDPNDNAKIRVKFASAPASGTDNVKIIWEAQVV